jgi:hypothetical protein
VHRLRRGEGSCELGRFNSAFDEENEESQALHLPGAEKEEERRASLKKKDQLHEETEAGRRQKEGAEGR